MDSMSYRNNRPAQRQSESEQQAPAPQPQAAAPAPVHSTRAKHSRSTPNRKKPLFVAAIIIAVVLVAVAAWYALGKSMGPAAAIDGSKYQAVFFTNGQVYFGKLTAMNGDYMRLKNVYYLQNKTQDEKDSSPQSASKQDASNVELIKLGNEIHGPDDEMIISKDQVLFFENLKPAGTVSQTITNFQKKSN